MLIALTREVSSSFMACEVTHLPRVSIDVALAREQHERYERVLDALGCTVRRLPADPDLPDSVFIEDAAVVVDELAVVARPGAVSRRGEIPAVADALDQHRVVRFIESPGTLDGGDVLVAGRQVFVGRSARTNSFAIEQLRGMLSTHGYTIIAVAVSHCLHLKSAVTMVGDGVLLLNPQWVSREPFDGFELIQTHPSEPYAANALRIAETVISPASFPLTHAVLERRGLHVRTVDVSELAKAEGGVTCCSLIFQD